MESELFAARVGLVLLTIAATTAWEAFLWQRYRFQRYRRKQVRDLLDAKEEEWRQLRAAGDMEAAAAIIAWLERNNLKHSIEELE